MFPHFHGWHIDVMSIVTGLQLPSPRDYLFTSLLYRKTDIGRPYPLLVGSGLLTRKEKSSLPQPDHTDLTFSSNGGYLLPMYLYMLSHERNVHLTMLNKSATWQAYEVRSPKYIWATVYSCNVLIG